MDVDQRSWYLFVIITFLLILIHVHECHGQPSSTLEYTIYEEQTGNQVVGNVKTDSNLASRHPIEVLNQLTFSFRNDQYQLFTIDETNGLIKTRQPVDRDEMCEHQITCQIDLDVAVRPFAYYEIIKVVIYVLDINDNTPQFPQSRISRTVAETTNPGALIPIPSAKDKDSGVYGVQGYDIEAGDSENTKFNLRVTEHSDGSKDINLVLNEYLDREMQDFYSLTIRAYDGDRSPRTGFLIVDIIVSDSNDNSPKFDNNTYETTIYENLPRMTPILRVHATDPDSEEFGEVVYSFAESTPDEYRSIFGLSNNSGELFVNGVIDYEQEKSYQLTIQAKDKGPNAIPAFTRVNINVIDLNDLAPQISVNTLTPNGEAQILENADVGTFVAHLSVLDPDEDGRQRFDCDINSDLFELVELSGSNKEYTIVTNTVFDREDPEQGQDHEILLQCSDYGDPPLTSVEHVIVNVQDINDHAPYFSREYYYTSLQENNSAGKFILQMEAHDEDSGLNSDIKYSLQPTQPTDRGLIIIDASSGVVNANTTFDYETRSSYQYVVIATDYGDEPKSGTTTLNITILDVNDEYPVFNLAVCNLPVTENQDSGVLVETLTARDKDDPPFNDIKYSLDRAPVGTGDFHIDEQTGELFTNKPLDRESQAVYHLIVIARNDGDTIIQSMLNCTVHVLDENDNEPVIYYPSDKNNTIEISNKFSIGYMITQIVARDPDDGINGEIRFAIATGNDKEYFRIDDTTGRIYVNRPLEKVKLETVRLAIVVMDQGEEPLLATEDLVIVIDESVALPNASTSFLESSTMIILGVILAIVLLLACAFIAGACIIRKRRDADNKNKHINCKLGAHEALNASPSSSNNEDSSMNSDSSSNSVKDGQASDKEVTFTFDLDTAYLHKTSRGHSPYLEDTESPCKSRYSDRPRPHHSDPRKEFEFGRYDRSPVHLMPTKTSGCNTRTRLPINKRNSDNIADRSLEHTNDVFNLSNHTDMDSECSGTDSGRGASEEGDHVYSSQTVHPYPHGPFISREPLGAPLYEVPENGWQDSESELSEQYHGFPTSAKHIGTQIQQNQSQKTEAEKSSRLPRVEPVGMYKASSPQRTSIPDQSARQTNKIGGRAITQSPQNYKLNGQSKIAKTPNSVENTALKSPQSEVSPPDYFELQNGNDYLYQRNKFSDAPKNSSTKTLLENQNRHSRQNESRDTSFINHQHKLVKTNNSIKKAVQFADQVTRKSNDVSNVRASNGHALTFQKQDRSPLEVRVTEKPKQNQSFYEDMDCLSYSVV